MEPVVTNEIDSHTFTSTTEMAQALGYTQVQGESKSWDRQYTKEIPTNDGHHGEVLLGAGFFGPDEEIDLAVYYGSQHWKSELGRVIDVGFFDRLKELGISEGIIDNVRQLPVGVKGFKQEALKGGGYNHIARLLAAMEQTDLYPTELARLQAKVKEKYAFYEQIAQKIVERFPQYDIKYNATESDDRLYFVDSRKPKKGRVPAMWYRYIQKDGSDVAEFQIGSARIGTDTDGNQTVTDFFKVDPPKLTSTSHYPVRVFWGKFEDIFPQSLDARQKIIDELNI